MLSFVKKYVMKKIGYGSSSKPINIEDIKTDYESLVKSTFKSINTEDIKIGHESLFKSTDRTYSQYSLSNLLKDIGNINNVDNINMNYKPAKEGPLLGTMDLRQQENFQKSLENVILFRTSEVCASQMESITRGNRDLVLLLLLIYSNVSVDNNIELLKDLIKDYSGSRVEMIKKIHLLGKEGKLSIKSSECLDRIIKMSTFIEKQCRSNIVSVMNMVSSGNVDGLVQDVEARVKNLIGIGIGYDKHSPASSLKDLSIDTLVKHGLIE